MNDNELKERLDRIEQALSYILYLLDDSEEEEYEVEEFGEVAI